MAARLALFSLIALCSIAVASCSSSSPAGNSGGFVAPTAPVASASAAPLGSTTATADTPPPEAVSGAPASSRLPLSRDAAIAIARGLGIHTATSPLLSATVGPFHQFGPAPNGKISEPADAQVWQVVFAASATSTAFVILDGYTGALVETGLGVP